MPITPEDRARQNIDKLLEDVGTGPGWGRAFSNYQRTVARRYGQPVDRFLHPVWSPRGDLIVYGGTQVFTLNMGRPMWPIRVWVTLRTDKPSVQIMRGRRMEIDVNSVVLATRIYAALREHFFIGNGPRDSTEADGGEVLATIRDAIVNYVEEQIGAS